MPILQARYIEDSKLEAGIDEAGRGPFWGPLMAAAVIMPAEESWTEEQRKLFEQIKDSKKIAEKKRIRIAEEIKKHAVAWGVGTVSAQEIDENGMTWSNQTVFARAVSALETGPDRLIVDGIVPLQTTFWPGEQHTVTDGDAIYISVAAASIIAKVSHDAWILEYCKEHPELNERYNLEKCKGYGTARHIAGIKEHGLDEHHRRLFLRKLLGTHQHQYQHSKKEISDTDAFNTCMIMNE